jgi:hypothetical protein
MVLRYLCSTQEDVLLVGMHRRNLFSSWFLLLALASFGRSVLPYCKGDRDTLFGEYEE